jgi:imidazolonepropionase-like amidohydrolase
MKNILYILIGLFSFYQTNAQQVQKSTNGKVLLQNGTLVTVTNGNIEADLLISEGKITEIEKNITPDTDTEIIDCSGKFVYPGFIDSGTRLGLIEVGSVSLTQDHNEIGDFTPHLQALTAINPNSVSIPVTRVNGITTVLSTPSGGTFPGTAALVNLIGYTPQQMDVGFRAVIMNFPSTGRTSLHDSRSSEEIQKKKVKVYKRLKEVWDNAQAYNLIDLARKQNKASDFIYQPEMEALLPVIRGDVPLFLEVNKKEDIDEAIGWLKDKDISVVLTGVADGWRVADTLAKLKIPVITGPVLKNPSRSSDRYDTAYKNAGIMAKAGVLVAIRTNETENVRNLPFQAGFAANYGLGKEEALKAITINPAKIMGIDNQYGSLEKGKIANLFVCDGDPFEPKTQLSALFIKGWKIPLESRHTLMYEEFLDRSPGLDK